MERRGFTLIELLVVIAIIGILAAIVMGSLNTARAKGQDAAAKSELNGVRQQGAIYYDDNGGTYGAAGTDCANPSSVFDPAANNSLNTLVVAAQNHVGGGAAATCANDASTYAVALTLNSGQIWCVDSTGYSNFTTLALTGPGSVQATIACQ